jgi:hypothetical protein
MREHGAFGDRLVPAVVLLMALQTRVVAEYLHTGPDHHDDAGRIQACGQLLELALLDPPTAQVTMSCASMVTLTTV